MSEEDAVAREKAIARANLAKVVTLQKEKKALEKTVKDLKLQLENAEQAATSGAAAAGGGLSEQATAQIAELESQLASLKAALAASQEVSTCARRSPRRVGAMDASPSAALASGCRFTPELSQVASATR